MVGKATSSLLQGDRKGRPYISGLSIMGNSPRGTILVLDT